MNTNAPPTGSGGGAERRRYKRLAIKLDALVAIDGRPPVACTVRDFCVAGIFASIAPQLLRLVKPQLPATLYFSLIVDDVAQDLQLGLTIMRVVGSGFGCAFYNAEQSTLALLQSLAVSSNPGAVADTAESLSRAQRSFSPLFARVREPLGEIVADFANNTAEAFLSRVDEALFLAARDAKNNREETRYLDGQNEIRNRGGTVRESVPDLLGRAISLINSPLSEIEEESAEPSLSELSLIDKEEFEEFLTVSQLVSELEPHFKDPLYDLGKRFSLLAQREVNENSNPIGPAVVGGVFAEALKNLQSDRSAINVVYRTLRQVLEPALNDLYGKVNELLIDAGVLPVVEKERTNFKRPGTSAEALSAAETPPEPIEDLVPFPEPGQVAPAPPGGANFAGQRPAQNQSGPVPNFPQVPASPQAPGAPHVGGALPPSTQVVSAAPPGGGFGVIDPALNAGAVEAAPPSVAPARTGVASAGVEAAPPSLSGAAAPQVSAGVGGMPMGSGLEATFGGFGAGPAVYIPPSLQQAFNTAQTQMALRRELLPEAESEALTIGNTGPVYQHGQVVDGLTQLQQALASTQEPRMLDVHGIKERVIEAIEQSSGVRGTIGQNEGDAIEVIANLFEVLIEDALLTETAKSQLTRLQAPVHKAALMDPAFFEATDHPVRQLLNRVSMLRDSRIDGGAQRVERAADLISKVNTEFNDDMSVLQPIVDEFDQILRDQRDAYNNKIAGVVRSSEEQERVLSERRDKNLEATDSSLAQNDLPEEWNRWLDRGKLLESGDRMVMNANTSKPSLVTLVWVGPGYNPYVFVDEAGEKTSTLTLQQVAMYLRRGTLKPLLDDEVGAVDRALFGVVNRMHGEVEVRATQDELTAFMNRKTFLQVIERNLPERESAGANPVLCQLTVANLKDINVRSGTEAGDDMLAQIAGSLRKNLPGKAISFGRLSGTELGIFWHKGGLQNAYRRLQTCFDALSEITLEKDDEKFSPLAFAGITAVDDSLTTPEQLLSVVNDACKVAESSKEKQIYVAGSENKHREQLEQMVSYIGKAFDRERLVLLHQYVTALGDESEQTAVHMVVTAEDRNGKLIPPGFFSQALANFDRAFDIDEWTLKQTFAWMAANSDDVDAYAAVIIPLSHEAVKKDDLSNIIINLLMETAVPPGKILFEIDDKDAVANVTETAELVRILKEFGCRFILDEFGSGQGNYDYVKDLAVDFVTIGTGYIAEAKENPKDFAMAKSINELIHFMGKKTIGKQDPGKDVIEILREIGVDFLYDQSKTNRIAA